MFEFSWIDTSDSKQCAVSEVQHVANEETPRHQIIIAMVVLKNKQASNPHEFTDAGLIKLVALYCTFVFRGEYEGGTPSTSMPSSLILYQ